jgi:hypothetical protein
MGRGASLARRLPQAAAMVAALALALAAASVAASRLEAPPGPGPSRSPRAPAELAELQAARILARLADGEPDVETVQRAAAAAARADPEELDSWRRAAGRAAWLPKLSAQVSREDRSWRVYGLTGSGEVDYLRAAPGLEVQVRAVWELDALIFSASEVRAAEAAAHLLRRREELVARATRLYFERQRLRVALLLAPPEDPAERMERELALEEVTAGLDALTGGLYRQGRAR